jgi:hypothetical protein
LLLSFQRFDRPTGILRVSAHPTLVKFSPWING